MPPLHYASLAASLGIRGFMSGDELRAKCPLHSDSTPSFSMNVFKGTWICFKGCGAGEFFRLVQLVLGCTPGEARDWIASNGTQTSVEHLSAHLNSLLYPEEDPDFMPDNMGWRVRYQLLDNKAMPLWFLQRGFSWETVNHWHIKYDPMWDSVVIPVLWKQELVGTITRNSHPDLPKYQNSKNLPRAEILFGDISTAKNEIILVEGVLDTIWLWQNGYNAGGLLGDYLTERQAQILTELRFGQVTLALDNDQAGFNGSIRAVQTLRNAGWLLPQIKVMWFPGKPGTAGYKKDAQDCDPDLLDELVNKREDVLGL